MRTFPELPSQQEFSTEVEHFQTAPRWDAITSWFTESLKVYFMRWNIFLCSYGRDYMEVEVSSSLSSCCHFSERSTIYNLLLFYYTKLLADAYKKRLLPDRQEDIIIIHK